jgi:DNA-binding CsgD family transcriptional regulator
MSDSTYLQHWIDLTAHLLTLMPDQDPLVDVCSELSAHFDGASVGTMDLGARTARVGPYRVDELSDMEYYARNLGDHPLIRHYLETGDRRARALAEATRFSDRWARELVGRAHDDGLIDFVFLPLPPRPGMTYRWIGMGCGERQPPSAVALYEALGSLLRALDGISATREFVTQAALERCRHVGLTARELTVLTLTGTGLTAVAIANRLQISPRTVSKHQQSSYRKLGARDRVTAVLEAQRAGVLAFPGERMDVRAVRFTESQRGDHDRSRLIA